MSGTDSAGATRRWALVPLAILLAAGAAIGLYLTRFHEIEMYGDQSATLSNCPRTETTNCEVVNTSGYSEIAGLPISALAIPTYLLLLILVLRSWRDRRHLAAIFAVGLLTFAYSLYLFYVSRFVIGYLCLWCFRLYLINTAIPLLAALAAGGSPLRLLREAFDDLRRLTPDVRQAATIFAGLLIATASIDQIYRAGLTRVAPSSSDAAQTPGAPQSGVEGVVVPIQPGPVPITGEEPPAQTAAAPQPAAGAPPGAAARPPATTRPVTAPQTARQTASPAPVEPAAGGNAPAAPAPASGAFVIPGPLQMIQASQGQLRVTAFDLQARIGKGKPVALLFWAPGYALSEETLVTMSRFLAAQNPPLDVYAIAGRREDQRLEMIWEAFSLLDVPAAMPLLVDEKFGVSKQLDTTEVPDLLLIDGAGRLVASKVKGLSQVLATTPAQVDAQDLIRRVGRGEPVAPLPAPPFYYPATELYGHCAPEFSLPDLSGARDVTFHAPSANGKPTLLMFWSSTCKHCQKEIPQLLRYVRAHPDEFNVVSVALIKPDRPDGTSHRRITEAYVRANAIPWTVLDDSSSLAADLYRIVSTPTTFLLTPGGTIAGAWYHPHEDIDAAIHDAMSKLNERRGACQPAPAERVSHAALTALDPQGRSVTLASLTDRPAVVHFWATWCVPCQTELPDLLKFRDDLEKEGGRLVLVSVEDAPAGPKIEEFGARLGERFASLRAPHGGLADRLDLSYSVPRTFLVGRDGQVLRTYYGAQKWGDATFRQNVRTLLQLPRARG